MRYNRFRYLLSAGITSAACSVALAAGDIEIAVDSNVKNVGATGPKAIEIKVFFRDLSRSEKPNLNKRVIKSDSPLLKKDASAWLVKAKKKDKEEEVKIKSLRQVPASGDAAFVILEPTKPLEKDTQYVVSVAKGIDVASSIRPEWNLTNATLLEGAKIEPAHIKEDLDFIGRNKALESKVSVQSGKDNSATLKLVYGFNEWNDGRPSRFQALLKAEAAIDPPERYKYIQRIDGEIDWAYTLPRIKDGPFGLTALSELGLAGKIESDQYFKDTDGTVGLIWWNAINAKALQDLGKWACIFGDKPENISSLVFNVGYDWVFKLIDNVSGSVQQHDTTHRIRAKAYWSILLAHNVSLLEIIGHSELYDASFVIDAGGAYDFLNSRFLPDVNLSVEVGPASPDKSKPSVFITYENGKTRAKFQNYDAILGGVKLPF